MWVASYAIQPAHHSNSLGYIHLQSITTRIMNPALHSSPPSTQITYTEYPVELNECRNYLEGLGMSPAEADELLSSNRRESFFVDNADFVNIMEQLIRTGKYGRMRHYDIDALKFEWQSRNETLEAQFKAVQTRILLDSLNYLSAIKYEHAVKNMLEFIRSGANNYRINFVMNVLPLLLNNPTSNPTHQHPTTKDPRTTQTPDRHKKRAPKSKAQPSNTTTRKSARIQERLERLQKDSKRPTSPPQSRRQNRKRQVRRRS